MVLKAPIFSVRQESKLKPESKITVFAEAQRAALGKMSTSETAKAQHSSCWAEGKAASYLETCQRLQHNAKHRDHMFTKSKNNTASELLMVWFL